MIDWSKLGNLIVLKEKLCHIFEVLDPLEVEEYKDFIQMVSDRLYNRIREVYQQYEIVVKEEKEK